MHDCEEKDSSVLSQDAAQLFLLGTPPLRLAGIDEDDEAWEPHLVRGID